MNEINSLLCVFSIIALLVFFFDAIISISKNIRYVGANKYNVGLLVFCIVFMISMSAVAIEVMICSGGIV